MEPAVIITILLIIIAFQLSFIMVLFGKLIGIARDRVEIAEKSEETIHNHVHGILNYLYNIDSILMWHQRMKEIETGVEATKQEHKKHTHDHSNDHLR